MICCGLSICATNASLALILGIIMKQLPAHYVKKLDLPALRNCKSGPRSSPGDPAEGYFRGAIDAPGEGFAGSHLLGG